MAQRRLHVLALAVVATCLALILSRPWDGALFRGADTGSAWSEHTVRIEAMAFPPSQHRQGVFDWLQALDVQYPPLLHLVSIGLSPVVGASDLAVNRSMVLWLLALALGAGLAGRGLTGKSAVGLATGVGTLTVPAFTASALHYYYDLPMTALLWCSLGCVLMARRSHALPLGIAAGLLFAGACLVKWSALPQGIPLLLGALLVPLPEEGWGRRAWIERLRVAGPTLLCAALVLFAFTQVSTSSWREMGAITLGEPGQQSRPSLLQSLHLPDSSKVGAYIGRTVTALFSPLLSVLVVLGLLRWVFRDRRGWPLLALGLVGNIGFLLFLVPPADERFLFPVVPALILAAVLGTAGCSRRVRTGAATLWVVLALSVTWDVHHGSDGPLSWTWESSMFGGLRGRGLSLDSGEEAVGWTRADDAARERALHPGREELYNGIVACGAQTLIVERGALSGPADMTWWRYRNFLQQAGGRDESFDSVVLFDDVASAGGLEGHGQSGSRALIVRGSGGGPQSPPSFGTWVHLGSLEWEDRGPIHVWVSPDIPSCRGWDS